MLRMLRLGYLFFLTVIAAPNLNSTAISAQSASPHEITGTTTVTSLGAPVGTTATTKTLKIGDFTVDQTASSAEGDANELDLAAGFDCSPVTEIPAIECEALVTLYNSTDGPDWTNSTGWLVTNFPCNWHRITCSGNQVSAISLEGNQLTGEIPPELGDLGEVTDLSLFSNHLTGTIPPKLGNMINLEQLELFDNRLIGSIPPELGDLDNLRVLRLNNNQLSGSIPADLGKLISLQVLNLQENHLSGIIPPELGNLASLRVLRLENNRLTGSIPPVLGNLFSLHQLALGTNQLSGSVPPELGNLTSLLTLSLNDNQLSGSIPPELGNLTSLLALSLGANQLSGSIPPELGSLASLLTLRLNINQLSGGIPPELGDLGSLQFLQLSGNLLDGGIPPELGELGSLQFLQLSGNLLEGGIPPELGNLASLRNLFLTGNLLAGSIPVTFTNLSLSAFRFDDTNLCEPPDPVFQAWMGTVSNLVSTEVQCVSSGNIGQPSLDLYQHPADGVTGFKVDVTRVFDPSTGDDVNVDLETFQAGLTYLDATDNPSVPAGTLCIELLGPPRELDFPITNSTIDNAVGSATFEGSDLNGVTWPAELGYISTRLNGSANQACRLDLDLSLTADTSGSAIEVPPILDQVFQRGDTQADGNVTIDDALFIAQHLVGSTDACTAPVTTSCLHSVNAASVRPDGGFDKKTIADALFVAQYLVGMRDEFYNLIP